MKEPYRKGESDSILTLSLAVEAVRSSSKRRQGHQWAGRLSFENVTSGTPTCSPEGKAMRLAALDASSWLALRSLRTFRTLRNNMHENRETSGTSRSNYG